MNNKRIWDRVKEPPKSALKSINAGRLKGMTDIKPQWRYEAMTELFGPVGFGWYHTIDDIRVDRAQDGTEVATVVVSMFVKEGDEWSNPIQGIGGSMLVAKESAGNRTSDEAFKMAETDALSVAMKRLGVGASIYYGRYDGSKYSSQPEEPAIPAQRSPEETEKLVEQADKMAIVLRELMDNTPDVLGLFKSDGYKAKMLEFDLFVKTNNLNPDIYKAVADHGNQLYLAAKEEMEGRG